MGCASSSPATAAIDKPSPPKSKNQSNSTTATTASNSDIHANSNGTPAAAIADTTDTTDAFATKPYSKSSSASDVKVGNLSLRYACLSRRGRDPDHANKPNQDCYGDHLPCEFGSGTADTANDENEVPAAFFAVYDGHGPTGEECSHFARKRIPALLKGNVNQMKLCRGPGDGSFVLSTDEIHAALHDAHVDCNDELRRSSQINDSQSGTTSVGVFVHDDKITVSNVGDSRIVLGTTDGGTSAIQAIPLSKDHTPYRPDEAARCRANGARILSFGQIDPSTNDGDDDDDIEDPPRVWSPKGNYPGTAFTRSIGDSIAELYGVTSDPEMLTLPLSSHERLLVLASDGVFDVMTNQDVVDLCYKYRGDPKRACEEVIERSHKEWLLNDDCCEDEANYDDMTCVIIFFDHPGQQDNGADAGVEKAEDSTPQAAPTVPRHHKRVRQKTLRNLEDMAEGVEEAKQPTTNSNNNGGAPSTKEVKPDNNNNNNNGGETFVKEVIPKNNFGGEPPAVEIKPDNQSEEPSIEEVQPDDNNDSGEVEEVRPDEEIGEEPTAEEVTPDTKDGGEPSVKEVKTDNNISGENADVFIGDVVVGLSEDQGIDDEEGDAMNRGGEGTAVEEVQADNKIGGEPTAEEVTPDTKDDGAPTAKEAKTDDNINGEDPSVKEVQPDNKINSGEPLVKEFESDN